MEQEKFNWFLYGSAFSANLLSFCAGSAFSWSSPVLQKLGSTDPEINPFGSPITTFEESWITSIICLGAITGTVSSPFVSNKYGRKSTLTLYSVTVLTAHLIFMFGATSASYMLARFIIGVGIGGTYSNLPSYLGEIAEDSNRGFLGCIMGFVVSLGMWFSYVVGPFVSIRVFSVLNLIPLVIFYTTFVIFVPESPYYYISRNDHLRAERSLKKLRVNKELDKEMASMKFRMNEYHSDTLKDMIASKVLRKSLLITIGIFFFQQVAGITAINGYMESIFAASRTSIPPHTSVILIGFIQLLSNALTSLVVDRIGRKILLLISCLGNCLSTGCLGTYFYLKANSFQMHGLDWLPTASLVVFMVTYNFGIGPLAWVFMGEVFPPNYKSVASSVTILFCSVMSYIVAMLFPYLSDSFGMDGTFWFFSGCCAISMVFVLAQIPETKGKSLQDIQTMLMND